MIFANRMKQLSGSKTSGMRNLARKLQAQGVHVVNFAAGELDQDTSDVIKDAVRKVLDQNRTQYTDTMGITALREALAARLSRKTGQRYDVEEVGFTSGAKQALFCAAFVCFQEGDEVIIPVPYWGTFAEQVRLSGASPVFLETGDSDFQIDLVRLEALITPRTRGIILNTPHNPTGAVYTDAVLSGIARLVLQHNLTCVFDECYDELVYAPAVHRSIVSLVPEVKERTILIGSFSKTYCMAGWRAGYIAGPKAFIKAVSNLQSHSASNPSNLVQYAALAAMDPANDAFVDGIRAQLARQRQAALVSLGEIPGLPCVVPQGAFYLFPDISSLLGKSFRGQKVSDVDRLGELLLEFANIAVVPGSAFGMAHHVRISYAIPEAEVVTGLKRLGAFVAELQG
ncbi:MAG: hypothetical protein RL095_837 [Verrucomicrobiota bacterium]